MKCIPPVVLALAAALALSACGFHLRRSASLPAGMQRVHVDVSGNSTFQRALARAVSTAGATVVDHTGPGIAVLQVPVARFHTSALTITGAGRISEYAVRFQVRFDVADAKGRTLVPSQQINMSREYTYDARQAIGSGTQEAALRHSLIQDMVRAVMSRLQAAAAHPAAAASTARPATALSTARPTVTPAE